jgi:acyl-CoA thioesterase-1
MEDMNAKFLLRLAMNDRSTRRRLLVRTLASIGVLSVLPAQAQTPGGPGNSGASGASRAPPVNDARPTLVVLGDSLSAEYGLPRGSGWVALLQQRLATRGHNYRIVNASISGETSSGGVSRIDGLLKRQQPAIVIIELGGNDALRGLDLAATRANLLKLARRSRESGARVLILGMHMPPNYGVAYGESFARIFVEVARETDSALVPFFLEDIGERLEYFQADRIHPNETAQPLMLERAWPALQPLL